MTNLELIKELSIRLDRSQNEIKRLLKNSIDIIIRNLDKEKSCSIPGLGKFYITNKNKRRAFDPYRKLFFIWPRKRVVSYKPSSILKEKLKDIQ